jgi:hypothetical protein
VTQKATPLRPQSPGPRQEQHSQAAPRRNSKVSNIHPFMQDTRLPMKTQWEQAMDLPELAWTDEDEKVFY